MKKIVLATVAGRDRPGLAAMLTSTFRRFQVHVLDVGHSVIHGQLDAPRHSSIGMRVRGEPDDARRLKAALLCVRTALGFDYSVQRDPECRRVAAFDVDSTLSIGGTGWPTMPNRSCASPHITLFRSSGSMQFSICAAFRMMAWHTFHAEPRQRPNGSRGRMRPGCKCLPRRPDHE